MVAAKRPRLGRGLDALLAGSKVVINSDEIVADVRVGDELKKIPVDRIMRGTYQPRHHFEQDALEELADSIREQGVLQPIVVRQMGDKYEIVAGERRWRATQLAGIDDIPVVVKKFDDKTAAAASLIENIQRENLNSLEESQALQRLIDEFGLTHKEVAQAVGRSRAGVTNLLRLLELPEDVKKLLDESKISMGHARAILGLPQDQKSAVACKVVAKDLSVRECEKLVKVLHNRGDSAVATSKKVDPNIRVLERDLADKLMTVVTVQHNNSGKGKLVISYNSLDELDGILAHII